VRVNYYRPHRLRRSRTLVSEPPTLGVFFFSIFSYGIVAEVSYFCPFADSSSASAMHVCRRVRRCRLWRVRSLHRPAAWRCTGADSALQGAGSCVSGTHCRMMRRPGRLWGWIGCGSRRAQGTQPRAGSSSFRQCNSSAAGRGFRGLLEPVTCRFGAGRGREVLSPSRHHQLGRCWDHGGRVRKWHANGRHL